MFKKSLLALALTGAAVSANASTINYSLSVTGGGAGVDVTAIDVVDATADVTISSQSLTKDGKIAAFVGTNGATSASTAVVETNAQVALWVKNSVTVQNGDFVYVTLPGAVFDTTKSPSIKLVSLNASADNTDNDITIADSVLSFIKYEGEAMVFGATNSVAAGSLLSVGGFELKSGTSASITPSFKATNTTIGDYAAGSAKKDYTVVDQFAKQAFDAKLNAVIDTAADRKVFESNATSDVLEIDLVTTAATKLPVTGITFDVTVKGDFTVLDTDGDNKLETGEGSVAMAGVTAANTSFAADLSSVTFKGVSAGASQDITISLPGTAANRKVLSPQNFTATVVVDYTSAGASAVTDAATNFADTAAGSWTLNGSVIQVPYIPFGDNTAPILRLTNSSTKEGGLTVRYMIEGTDASWKTLGELTTVKPGLTDLRDLVIDAVKADAAATSGKVALELTTNVPKNNVDVTAGFKVKSELDRGIVATRKVN